MSKSNTIERSVIEEILVDFIRRNDGDDATQYLLFSLGSELLDESIDALIEKFDINFEEDNTMENTLYIDEVTGTLGEWLDMDTSDIPVEAMKLLQAACDICVKEL